MEAEDLFRFRIDDVFTITGRGTVVTGSIEQGTVRAGDLLRLIRGHGSGGPAVVCRAVDIPCRAGWRPGDPVRVGLVVPDLAGHDAKRSDVLEGAPPAGHQEESASCG